MKKLVLSLGTVISMCLVLGLGTAVLAADSFFSDVPSSHWAYTSIQEASEKGWVNGVGNGKFEPDKQVTGAELITMITRMLYKEEVQSPVPGEAWYKAHLAVANAHHILSNEAIDLTGKMEAPLTRQELAFILAQTLRDQQSTIDLARFCSIPDLMSAPNEYLSSIGLVYSYGILTGVDDKGTFAGNQTITRAQVAAVLSRLNEVLTTGESLLPPPEDPEKPVVPSGAYTSHSFDYGNGESLTFHEAYLDEETAAPYEYRLVVKPGSQVTYVQGNKEEVRSYHCNFTYMDAWMGEGPWFYMSSGNVDEVIWKAAEQAMNDMWTNDPSNPVDAVKVAVIHDAFYLVVSG